MSECIKLLERIGRTARVAGSFEAWLRQLSVGIEVDEHVLRACIERDLSRLARACGCKQPTCCIMIGPDEDGDEDDAQGDESITV